jgi:DNA processing protein
LADPLPQIPLKTEEDLLNTLQLARSENVGPITFHRLLKLYGTAESALYHLPQLAAQGGLKRSLHLAARIDVEQELEATQGFCADIITIQDTRYPSLLRHIDSAPPVLTIKGQTALLEKQTFALVGARNASAMGKKMAIKLAKDLGVQGWAIASGLARGIDTAAHEGSLETGTIAVLAGGIDNIYPQENEALYHKIAEKGVLIAESPFGTQPQSTLFPRRNRIISGISKSVLVVEAALKSGSLITARYALEQGRDVFAIPGHPLDPRARGCNKLIKNGAILVEGIEDIEHEITLGKSLPLPENENLHEEKPSPTRLKTIRQIINENLSPVPINVDEMIRECHLSPSEVWVVLLEMEIAGRLERYPGGKVSLKEDWKSE